jgi:hypothetical protein
MLPLSKSFFTVEKTGLLGQLIRCIPVDPECSAEIVTSLQSCLQLVKKKLKSGTPTGDILDAVIAGKDGPISEKVKADLAKLQTLARLSNGNKDHVRICRHCGKIEAHMDSALLMKCQRCKVTYYCSKECQVVDWKSHKKMCNSALEVNGNASRSTIKTSDTTMRAFVQSNYFNIVKEVYKKTQEYNVPKRELLLEIDFCGDSPALRNEFKVSLTSDFLEGSSVADAPHWCRTHNDKKTLVRGVKDQYENVTSDNLLVVCRAGNGTVSIQSLHFLLGNAGDYQLLSDEAVESIGREDYVRMVAFLGQSTTNQYFEGRSGLTRR